MHSYHTSLHVLPAKHIGMGNPDRHPRPGLLQIRTCNPTR
jgi:hypothetical protein